MEIGNGKLQTLCIATDFSATAGIGLPSTRIGSSYKKASYLPFSGRSLRYCTDNTYPQILASFAYDSPTHGAAIERKKMMIKGEGFNLEALSPKFKAVMENINENGETSDDILEKVALDYAIFGGISLKVIWGANGKIKYVEHLPFDQVRCGTPNDKREIDYYVICNNWNRTLTVRYETVEVLPAFNPNFFGENSIPIVNNIPSPSQEQLQQSQQVIYWFDKKPAASDGMLFYPIPDYQNGLDAVATEIEIGVSNKSLLDNGFGAKTIVTFPFFPGNEGELRKTDEEVKRSFTSAKNNGSAIILYGVSKELVPDITNLEAIKADCYIELDRNIKQSICTAHKIPAILLELNLGGGFNNRAEEMQSAYQIFQKTVIKSYQQKIVGLFKRLAKYMGYPNEQIEIIPFSLAQDNQNVTTQSTTSVQTN